MTLALDLASLPPIRISPAPPSAPPFDDEPGPRPVLHLVAVPEPPFVVDETVWFTEERTPTAELPDATVHVRALAQALVEVYAGARPLTQLRWQLSMDLYAELARHLHGGRRAEGGRPDPRSVRSVHVQTRAEGVAEACVTVVRRGVVQALALRLEGARGRWVCTDVEGHEGWLQARAA